jgi:hypothetical protein
LEFLFALILAPVALLLLVPVALLFEAIDARWKRDARERRDRDLRLELENERRNRS